MISLIKEIINLKQVPWLKRAREKKLKYYKNLHQRIQLAALKTMIKKFRISNNQRAKMMGPIIFM